MGRTLPSLSVNTMDTIFPDAEGPTIQSLSSGTAGETCSPMGAANLSSNTDSTSSALTPCFVTLLEILPVSQSNSKDLFWKYQ